jgi:hypothetical protein
LSAKALLVSCENVEECPEESNAKVKPVIDPESIGETTLSPVIAEVGTVEMPLFARMAKLQADTRSTGVGELGLDAGQELGSGTGLGAAL